MRESVRNFSIGIVSTVALGGLSALLLLFGEFTGFIESRSPVDVLLNGAGGLRKGSLVTLHGVPVGLVDRIEFASDNPTHPVLVHLLIDATTPIPLSALPVVESSLLGSGAKLELQSTPVLTSAGTYDLASHPRLVGEYQAIDTKFIAALDERLTSLRASLDSSLADFRAFATTYTALGKNLNDLVQPVRPGTPEAEGNLRTTVERLNQTLSDARDAIRLAREWLSDESIKADVKLAVKNANELILRATDAANTINGFAMNLDADRSALVAHLVPVFDEARGAMTDLRRLLAAATTGDGTIGLLLKDPALYKDLAESARHLSAALEAIQAVAERLKAEGIILKF